MGQQPFASQAMGGMTGQLAAFSEAMATSPALGQGNGMPPKPNAQQLKQGMIGQIPAGPGSQAGAKQQLDGSSAPSIPALPGFGMVGHMPGHALNPSLVGQLPPQSMYQQPVSFGFQQHLLGQQLNMPLASAGMSLPPHNQFGFGQQFGMFPNALQRPGPLVAGSHVGSIDGSVYNLPDSASVMSRTSAAQPTANPPVVSLASLSTQQKVYVSFSPFYMGPQAYHSCCITAKPCFCTVAILLLLVGSLHATTPLSLRLIRCSPPGCLGQSTSSQPFGLAAVVKHMLSACRSRCFVVLVGSLPARLVGGSTRVERPAWSQSAITVTCRSCRMPCIGCPRPCGLT